MVCFSSPFTPVLPFFTHTQGPEEGIEFFDQAFRNLTYHCCCLTYCAWGYRPGIGWEPNDQGGVEDSLSVILHAGLKLFGMILK